MSPLLLFIKALPLTPKTRMLRPSLRNKSYQVPTSAVSLPGPGPQHHSSTRLRLSARPCLILVLSPIRLILMATIPLRYILRAMTLLSCQASTCRLRILVPEHTGLMTTSTSLAMRMPFQGRTSMTVVIRLLGSRRWMCLPATYLLRTLLARIPSPSPSRLRHLPRLALPHRLDLQYLHRAVTLLTSQTFLLSRMLLLPRGRTTSRTPKRRSGPSLRGRSGTPWSLRDYLRHWRLRQSE